MRGVPNIAFFPRGKSRRKGFWMSTAGLNRAHEAVKKQEGNVHRAAAELGVCDQTVWRCIEALRDLGENVDIAELRRWRRRGIRLDVAVDRVKRIMNGNTIEIDGTNCPLAQRYEWEGHRMYASEAAHVSRAGPELRK